jgi:hypothetical protein
VLAAFDVLAAIVVWTLVRETWQIDGLTLARIR